MNDVGYATDSFEMRFVPEEMADVENCSGSTNLCRKKRRKQCVESAYGFGPP